MQDDAFDRVYAIEHLVKQAGNEHLLRDWRFLQTSDHFYYMCTKWFSDGDVHKYFNPYGSPYDAYINYMNILSDFIARIETASSTLYQSNMPENVQAIKEQAAIEAIPDERFKEMIDLKNLKKTEIKKLLKEIDIYDFLYAMHGLPKDFVEWMMPFLTEDELSRYNALAEKYDKPEIDSVELSREHILIKANALFPGK